MKKTILLLLLLPLLFAACGSDNDDIDPNAPTTFQIKSKAQEGTYRNVVAAYRQPDNTLKAIAKLGNIAPGQETTKILVPTVNPAITQVEVFSDAYDINGDYTRTIEVTIINITEHKNNIYTIPAGHTTSKVVDKNNPEQYPADGYQ